MTRTTGSAAGGGGGIRSSRPSRGGVGARPVVAHPVEMKQILSGDVVKLTLPIGHPDRPDPSSSAAGEPKGRNQSGRSWKVRSQKRASSLVKTRVNNQSKTWDARRAEKLARKEALELQTEMREEKRQSVLARRERRLENEKRRAENELRAMERSVQTLNVGRVGQTLKSLSKKQLRQIKKTRVNTKTGVVEYVPAYAK